MCHRTAPSERGFTLPELLVTLVIVGTLTAMATPSLGQLRAATALRTEASRLHTSLARARLLAVARARPVVVCPSRDGLRCGSSHDWAAGWLTFVVRGDHRQPAEEAAIEDRAEPAGPGILIGSPPSRDRLRFTPDGAAAGSNVTVRFCDERALVPGRTVVLSASGRVRRGADVDCTGGG